MDHSKPAVSSSIRTGRPGHGGAPPDRPGTCTRAVPVVVLTLLLAALLWQADQPLLENYIGRQVPTAMVARRLLGGGSPLYPEMSTGPFPNYFLVEFPLDQVLAVGLVRLAGVPLDAAGRAVSALAAVTAAWCVFRLAATAFGPSAGRWALVAFATLPLTIRYGRAFQPDMLMVAALLVGLDRFRAWMDHGGSGAAVASGIATAIGLLVKVIDAPILIVFAWLAWRRFGRSWWSRKSLGLFGAAVLIPSLVWYTHAWRVAHQVAHAGGSRSAALNWRALDYWIVPSAWLHPEWSATLARFLAYRSFGLIGSVLLGAAGLRRLGGAHRAGPVPPAEVGGRMMVVWGWSLAVYGIVFSGKLHHEYYLVPIGPLAAVVLGRTLAGTFGPWGIGRPWKAAAKLLVTLGLIGTAVLTLAHTTRLPAEWASVPELARRVRRRTPPGALVIAPDCVLYYGGRSGYRMEYSPASLSRLALDWPVRPRLRRPEDLIEHYRAQGARFFADCEAPGDPARVAVRRYVRRHYRVIAERPGRWILAAL